MPRARLVVVNKIVFALSLYFVDFTLSAEIFRTLEGDGSCLSGKISPGQEVLIVKPERISHGPYSITNTPSGIFTISRVFLTSEGLAPNSKIRLYFCPEETHTIRTVRSWHKGDLYTDADNDGDYCGYLDEHDVKLTNSIFQHDDEFLVFCYRHLDDIGRENIIGAFTKSLSGKIQSRSFLCFYQNAFRLGAIDLRNLEQDCRHLRMKTTMTRSLYYALIISPFLFFLFLRHRRWNTHHIISVVIYCIGWIALCIMTLYQFNASDIAANLLLTIGCVAHAIYLGINLVKPIA